MHRIHPPQICRVLLPLSLLAALPPSASAARIPEGKLFADDGAEVRVEGAVTFAVLGNARPAVPLADRLAGRRVDRGVGEQLLADIAAADGLSFLVLLGDAVRSGSAGEWRRLARRRGEGSALPVAPVAGDAEARRDGGLARWAQAFPGVGVDIGYNRVASWYAFTLETQGHAWRVVVLDSGRDHLGSRWEEQKRWLPGALEGDYGSLLVLMHDPVYDLSGAREDESADPDAAELLEIIEDETDLRRLRAVLTAGGHASQALLPEGPFGPLHLGAGGGGAPAEDLRRWGTIEGRTVSLEPRLDVALQQALDGYADEHKVPDKALDRAKAAGSFEGFTGAYDAGYLPTWGWWSVTLSGEVMTLRLRHRGADGAIADRYTLRHTSAEGWKGL